jgi:transcriptional regulator with XRE-family HTH domain
MSQAVEDVRASLPVEDERSVVASRRRELAAYLRSRRSEISPESVGLVRQSRRRVSGLRRHEVADLAGVSDTWYTWLEQGRDIRVSADALDAIARALRLDDPARRYIRRLAGIPDVAPEPAATVGFSYDQLLKTLLPYPACVTTVAFDLVDWNSVFAFLFGDPRLVPEHWRNTLWMIFTTEPVRRTHDWEAEAQGAVARCRFESGNYPDEPRFRELVDGLSEISDEFRLMWNSGQVRPCSERVISIERPGDGDLNLIKFQMRALDQSRHMLTLFQPADPQTAQHLQDLMTSAEIAND